MDDFGEWIVKKGQWRLRVQPRTEPNPRSMTNGDSGMEIILVAVKLNAVSGQRGRNITRDYLS